MTRELISLSFAIVLCGCAHKSPPAESPPSKPAPTIQLIEHGKPAPAGTRTLIQFNDETPIIHVADGNYGPPILYHGEPVHPDQIKSIRVLKASEARERFPNQNVDAAILVELK